MFEKFDGACIRWYTVMLVPDLVPQFEFELSSAPEILTVMTTPGPGPVVTLGCGLEEHPLSHNEAAPDMPMRSLNLGQWRPSMRSSLLKGQRTKLGRIRL